MPRTKTFDENLVLEKAMELFWEKGYAATSIQDLVDHLGINRASLYDTYGGKDQLYQKSFELYRKKNTLGIQEFLNNEPDVRTGLKRLFESTIQESVEDRARKGCFVVNTTTELIPGHPEMLPVLTENKARIEQVFLDYLKKAESEGQIDPGKDLDAIASLLFTVFSGLKVVAKIDTRKESHSQTVSLALSLLD